jgi:tRNA/tmRNA/rRNA uracil-C5-methylase (TrmA/RlmC/RlmD family)
MKKKKEESVVDFGTCDMSRQEMNKALGSMPKLFDKSAPPTWKTRMAKLKLLAQIVNTLCQGGDAPAKERSAVRVCLSHFLNKLISNRTKRTNRYNNN